MGTKAGAVRPNPASYKIIGAAMKVHSALGAGLLESAYEKALCHQLTKIGLQFRRQVPIPIELSDATVATGFKADFIIENCVVVEVKSVEKLLPVHRTQLLSYLKLTKLPLGLILNFNVAHMREGIHRYINAPESEL
jgi:GxxExxY protein